MRLVRSKKGMTLIEAGFAITITSMIGVALLAMLSQSLVGWHEGTAQNTATNAATIAAQKLISEIRDGKSASFNAGVLTVVFPKKVTNPVSGEAIYDISMSDPVPSYFYIANGNLMKRVGILGTPVILERGVVWKTDNADLMGADNGEVNFTLLSKPEVGSVAREDYKKPSEQEVIMRVTLRNYRSPSGS